MEIAKPRAHKQESKSPHLIVHTRTFKPLCVDIAPREHNVLARPNLAKVQNTHTRR